MRDCDLHLGDAPWFTLVVPRLGRPVTIKHEEKLKTVLSKLESSRRRVNTFIVPLGLCKLCGACRCIVPMVRWWWRAAGMCMYLLDALDNVRISFLYNSRTLSFTVDSLLRLLCRSFWILLGSIDSNAPHGACGGDVGGSFLKIANKPETARRHCCIAKNELTWSILDILSNTS